MTIQHCFGSCETDGTCTPPAVPTDAITSASASFDNDASPFSVPAGAWHDPGYF